MTIPKPTHERKWHIVEEIKVCQMAGRSVGKVWQLGKGEPRDALCGKLSCHCQTGAICLEESLEGVIGKGPSRTGSTRKGRMLHSQRRDDGGFPVGVDRATSRRRPEDSDKNFNDLD